MKQENIVQTGEVLEELGNSLFRVKLDNSEITLVCTISGKIRKNFIRIMAGDKVEFEVSPYDLTKGRITKRFNTNSSPDQAKTNINPKNKKRK